MDENLSHNNHRASCHNFCFSVHQTQCCWLLTATQPKFGHGLRNQTLPKGVRGCRSHCVVHRAKKRMILVLLLLLLLVAGLAAPCTIVVTRIPSRLAPPCACCCTLACTSLHYPRCIHPLSPFLSPPLVFATPPQPHATAALRECVASAAQALQPGCGQKAPHMRSLLLSN